jgi:hypothetical protein
MDDRRYSKLLHAALDSLRGAHDKLEIATHSSSLSDSPVAREAVGDAYTALQDAISALDELVAESPHLSPQQSYPNA